MPRQTSIVTVIRNMVRDEMDAVIGRMFGPLLGGKRRKKRASAKEAPAATGRLGRPRRGRPQKV